MSINLGKNAELLEAPQEALQAIIYGNNRVILLALKESQGKTIEELQSEIREEYGIHEIYIGESQLKSLEKVGLIRQKPVFTEIKHALYILTPAGIIAVNCIRQLMERFKPLD